MKVIGYNTAEFRTGSSPQKKLGNKTLFTDIVSNNGGQTRYFSGTDAEIYFGDEYIDEVVEIQFSMQQNVMPLFGYNSYVYDDIAVGSRMVQGQFAVNFTSSGYMYHVLSTLQGIQTPGKVRVNANAEGTTKEYDNQSVATSGDEFWNREHSPVWDKRFDIWVSYGDQKKDNGPLSTYVILTGVQLTGVTQQLSIDGNPVLEIYSFIAQDIITTPRPAVVAGPTKTVEPPKDIVTFKSIVYEEESKVQYIQSGSITNVIPKYSASGHIKIEFESTVNILGMKIEPKLYLGNPKAEAGAVTVSYVSPVDYTVSDNLRADFKSYSLNTSKVDTFDIDIIVSYKDTSGNNHTETFTKQGRIKEVKLDL